MNKGVVSGIRITALLLTALGLTLTAAGQKAEPKRPVILIPGLTGSELINERTDEKVWFKTRRSRVDDISLPISPDLAANRDSLEAGDILRSVKAGILPRADVYGGLITFLTTSGGYREAKWESPPRRGHENSLYIFSYDWRRDNVENARSLVRRVESLKRRLNRPDLKFDIIAHSMGGLIARYAAMYGEADLPPGNSRPNVTWSGARNFDKIVLIGTPNEGSVLALKNLINGVSLLGIDVNLPFVRNLSKFDVFTIPAAYQLLPTPATLKAFDGELNPIEVDVYDTTTWRRYGWSPIDDDEFAKHFTPAEVKSADAYFETVLSRGRRFHEALGALPRGNSPVAITTIGATCKETLDSMIIYQKREGEWNTIFKADSYETNGGRKISSEELKKLLYGPGDGIVTTRSLLTETLSRMNGISSILFPVGTINVCEAHDSLPSNPETRSRILAILTGGSEIRVPAS